jgi:hypothetical protein
MGWTSYHRAPGETDREHFARELAADYEIVECATVDSVFYAAVRVKSTGEVWALIVLIKRSPAAEFNFACKGMSETEGPFYAKAPAKVLDALTPTTDENALEWRKKCRDRIARRAEVRKRRKDVKAGTTIHVVPALLFGNNQEASRFQCLERSGRSWRWLAITEDDNRFPCSLGTDWADRLEWEIEPVGPEAPKSA